MSQVQVTMPQLGETVAEGTVTRWLVAVGGEVRTNEPLLEVSTDKVDTEVVAPVDGVLASIAVAEDETVPVGTLLATVDVRAAPDGGVPDTDRTEPGPGDAAPVALPAGRERTAPEQLERPQAARPARTLQGTGETGGGVSGVHRKGPRHRDSPRLRRMARESGIDLETIPRTGQNGRATVQDVAHAARSASQRPEPTSPYVAPSPTVAPADPSPRMPGAVPLRGRVEKLSRRRRIIADRMVSSLKVAAQLTTVVEVDLTTVARLRARAKSAFRQRYDVPLTSLAFVAEATVQALADHPVVNARLDAEAGTVTYPAQVNLGIAVDTQDGLIVPVIHGANDLSLVGLAKRISDLASRSRAGSVSADELSGGTFTVTNTGSRGALFDTPILNQPESAILGFGAVVRRPAVVTGDAGEEQLAIRSMAYLSLTYDHRLVDGADASRYVTSVKNRLERVDPRRSDLVPLQED